MQPKQAKQKKQVKEMVNIHKNNKREDAIKQFQDFKLRIQEFENKNEQIINRIRDAYAVKKKVIQNSDLLIERNIANHAHYKHYDGQSASSCDYSKNVVFEGNMMKHSNIASNPFYNSNVEEYYESTSHKNRNPNHQMKTSKQQQLASNNLISNPQYEIHRYQNNKDYLKNLPSERLNTQQEIIINQKDYDPKTSGKFGYLEQDYAQVEQKYKQELTKNQELQEILAAKQEEISRIKSQQFRFKSYSNTIKHIFEDGIESYQEEVVSERFVFLQKYIKKCEQRLKNLSLKLKDAIEQKKSRKNIHRSRSKRNSVSRSRKEQSSLSQQAIESTPKISRYYPQSKGKNQSQNPVKHKQFQQIAADYENMVKAKTAQIERLQKRLNEQMQLKQLTANQLQKSKALLQQKQKDLSDIKKIKKPVKQDYTEGRQYKEIKEKLAKYQEDIKAKEGRQKQLNQVIQKLQKAKKTLHDQYTQNLNKNKLIKNKTIQELQNKLKQFQATHNRSVSELREKLSHSEKKAMEKQCEMMTVLNKLKKVENECLIKQQKLKELQNLLLKENDHGDLLDRSMSMDTSAISQTEIKHLHENIRRLDQEVQQQKGVIYDMQKEKYLLEQKKKQMQNSIINLSKANSSLEAKVAELKREIQVEEQQKDLARQLYSKNQLIQQYQADKELILQEKEELLVRNQELMDQLKKHKENNLTTNRQLIKTISELTFTKNEQVNLQSKLLKSKEQVNSLKSKLEELSEQRRVRESQLQNDNASLRQSVQNLKNHILELQTVGNRNHYEKQEDMLLNSLHVSQISFNYQPNKISQQEQINTLKEKVRDLQMALDIKTGTEQQIQNEYKSNLQIIRLDNADKKKELQRCRQQIQCYKKQIESIKTAQREDQSFQNYKLSMYQDKIVQMQEQYNVLKQSEERLNQMLHQIVQTIKIREEEKQKLMREVEDKQKIIQDYRELLEIKESKLQPHNKTMKSDTMKEFSLRISGDHSEELVDTAQLSYLSNISDVFKRDDVLQQKIKRGKTSREEQVKLFAKTSAYIKSLKAIIDTKQKRIKMLQKQLTSMKSQENKTWSDKQKSEAQRNYYTEQGEDIEECDQYKDYESVQLDTRRSKHQELIKQLINQKSLAVEENKILNKQIEALQDQILRSEEQQNSLVRIKDLYKDQIKKLIEKNQVHTKEFEIQINKMKEELQRSQSFHNLQAIKQLFAKIVGVITYLLDNSIKKDDRRDEKRKQLQDYINVMCSILHIDLSKDKPQTGLKK